MWQVGVHFALRLVHFRCRISHLPDLALVVVVVFQLVYLHCDRNFKKEICRKGIIHTRILISSGCTNHHWSIFNASVSMSTFACMMSTRVGEADHPGPAWKSHECTRLKCCVLNPTAMVGKTEQIVGLGADVCFVSETSATSLAQSQISKELQRFGVKPFWSPPVEKRFQTIDNRPSLRGESSGTAVLTTLFSRQSRIDVPAVVLETCRVATCVVSIGNLDILMVAIYGFPDNHTYHGTKFTDLLMTHVYNIVTEVKLPFIIGGDFNTPPHHLPCFEAFRNIGTKEVFSLMQDRFGIDLPPTCKNATRNDTCLMHPILAQRLVHAHVHQQFEFDAHSPLVMEFDFALPVHKPLMWDMPQSWKDFYVNSRNLEIAYQQNSQHLCEQIEAISNEHDGQHALHQWSSSCETAVHQALKVQHKLDPLRNPLSNLPKSAFGRCSHRALKQRCVQRGIRGDKFGRYNPPNECYSTTNRHKIRQLRRLKSYQCAREAILNRSENFDDIHPQWQQLQSEWHAICKARGFGNSWSHWIIGFEQVPFVAFDAPDINDLDIMITITQVDCDASCRQEAYQRKKRFQFAIQIDNSENFGTMTYKLMKQKSAPKLEEVPYQIVQQASLCRAIKGQTILRLHNYTKFGIEQKAFFGDSEILIHNQQDCRLSISVVKGILPSHANVIQHRITTTPSELFAEFASFWKPFWLRDQLDEQFHDDSWSSFVDEMNEAQLPVINLQVRIDDVNLWKKSIAKLKNRKSEGICGWRHEELKMLPDAAIEHLCRIFVKVWPHGLTCNLMQARTILLAKVEKPENINHGRPITILCTLYRLAAKVIFDQVVAQWAKILPHQISGGLPQRSVRDLSLMQASHIEESVAQNMELCGTSMDLIKAFNLVPRRPATLLLTRLGIPADILVFWAKSISRMTRLPFAFNQLGDAIPSTTGVPEGDAWSVLCMLGISTLFFFRVRTAYTTPFAYADNWSWITSPIKQQVQSWIRTLNMVSSMRMRIDPKKSWVWGTSAKIRKENDCLVNLFPAEEIVLETQKHVKDLGEIIQYNKQLYNAPLRQRLQETFVRIKRLKHLPMSIQEKAHKIQTGAWTYGMYGVDTHYVSPLHFNRLRRAVLETFIGNNHHGSSWLALAMLSKFVMDPLLFVLLSICRLIRRCFTYYPGLATSIVQRASAFVGKKAFGPATSFRKYLDFVGWSIAPDGSLSGPGMPSSTNCLHSSSKEVVRDLKHAFRSFVYTQVSHRQGLSQVTLDIPSTLKVFSKFSADNQAILANHILGGFQNEYKKSKWAPEANHQCPLCNQIDLQKHRFLECHHFEAIRSEHKEAIHILEVSRPNWLYHPIATQARETPLIKDVLQNIPAVVTPDDVGHSMKHHRYYTDGACENPTCLDIRRSAWAVVQDVSRCTSEREREAANVSLTTWQVPHFHTIVTGFTHGTQSPARAELLALTHACRHAVASRECESAEICVDAQYVINVVKKLEHNSGQIIPWHKIANTDVVRELQLLWNQKTFTLTKVKSHQKLQDALSLTGMWDILGNHYADQAAGSALSNIPQNFKDLISDVKRFQQQEQERLECVLKYFCCLAKARDKLLKQQKKLMHAEQATSEHDNAVFNDAIHKLNTYQISNGYNQVVGILQPQYANANIQGAGVAYAVWSWAAQLVWPQPDPLDGSMHPTAKWGITWFELLVNFIITTGWFPPLKISGSGSTAQFVSYMSPEGQMQLPSKRAASHLTVAFKNIVQCVQSLSLTTILPVKPRVHSATMLRLGYLGKGLTSLPIRPQIPHAVETMQYVSQYIRQLDGASALKLPLNDIHCTTVFHPPEDVQLEMDAAIRYRSYLSIWGRRKNGQQI